MTQRPKNADGTPWWVSSGPPKPSEPSVSEQISSESSHSEETVANEKTSEQPRAEETHNTQHNQSSTHDSSFFGISPEMQATAVTTGLGLLNTVLDMVAKPLSDQQQTTHDVKSCGVCPLCVAVAAIREQDAGLADLIESAMSGVTGSVEKLSGMLPDVMDKITEALVSAAVKALLNRN